MSTIATAGLLMRLRGGAAMLPWRAIAALGLAAASAWLGWTLRDGIAAHEQLDDAQGQIELMAKALEASKAGNRATEALAGELAKEREARDAARRPLTKEVVRYVQIHGSEPCLDPAGVGVLNDAIRGHAAGSGDRLEPAPALPAASAAR